MITWRKKRMVLQQFISDLFKPSKEEKKTNLQKRNINL